MAKATPRLGKGLSAIIKPRDHTQPLVPPPAVTARIPVGVPVGESETVVRKIPLDDIVRNPQQPRRSFDDGSLAELADSIRSAGILQPILVRRAGNGKFELIAGERRWRAARLAGLDTVPAIERVASPAEMLEAALIENLQREDLGPLERATAYQRYIGAFGLSADALAKKLGESRSNVANYLRLLKLDQRVLELIDSGQLGMGQARAVAGIADSKQQLAVASMAVRRNLSVRQVEALAKKGSMPVPATTTHTQVDSHLVDVERALSKAVGTAVRLIPGRKKNSGRIVIGYNSLEEFDRIAEKLGGNEFLE